MEKMTLNEFQAGALKTAIYPGRGKNLVYPVLGLNGEAGELAEKLKKAIRDADGIVDGERRVEMIKELGDVMWYTAACAEELGVGLEEVGLRVLSKLASRAERGQIQGSGDNR